MKTRARGQQEIIQQMKCKPEPDSIQMITTRKVAGLRVRKSLYRRTVSPPPHPPSLSENIFVTKRLILAREYVIVTHIYIYIDVYTSGYMGLPVQELILGHLINNSLRDK